LAPTNQPQANGTTKANNARRAEQHACSSWRPQIGIKTHQLHKTAATSCSMLGSTGTM